MRSLFATLRRLLLPVGALPSQPALDLVAQPELGQSYPDLVAYYAAQSAQVICAYILRRSPTDYVYDALIIPNLGGRPYKAVGGMESSGAQIEEAWRVTLAVFASVADMAISAAVSLRGNALSAARESINVAAAAGTTTSGVFVAMPGPVAVVIIKTQDATALEVTFSGTLYCTGAIAGVAIGATMSGGGGTVALMDVSTTNGLLNSRTPITGSNIVGAGAAAGSYTITAVWARTSGGGTLTMDGADRVNLTVKEVSV